MKPRECSSFAFKGRQREQQSLTLSESETNAHQNEKVPTAFCARHFSSVELSISFCLDFAAESNDFVADLLDASLGLIDALGSNTFGLFSRPVNLVLHLVFQGIHVFLLQGSM